MTDAATNSPATSSAQDAAGLIEQYYDKGFTDGLPIIPPTQESVAAMLAAAGLKGDEVLGEAAFRNIRVTADKVAVNAVMAGCLPEYMPVVVATVKGLLHPDFGYHGIATSTGGASVMVMVNGPIAKTLEINGGGNAFGGGVRANSTIGRAIRMVMRNAINTIPGKLDRSTLGGPGKISFCFAENEAASPWAPYHVSRGMKPEQSAVTVFASEGLIQVYNQLSNTPEPMLLGFADAMANLGSMAIVGQQDYFVVLAGEHIQVLRKAGWSKEKVQTYLFEHARRTMAELKLAGRLPGAIADEENHIWRHVTRTANDIHVVCAGGEAGNFSALVPGWGSWKTTRAVTTQI